MGKKDLIQITPFFGTGPLDRSVAFYRDIIGCEVFVHEGGYAYVERAPVAIRLLELDAGATNPPGCGHAYVDVHDVDALFAEMQPRLETIPAERWGKPKNQPYGQREYWVRDPDGNLLNFGQEIVLETEQPDGCV